MRGYSQRKKKKMKYHVVENTPGYLPDTVPTCFKSRRAAESAAADLAREFREDGYRTYGSARIGLIHAERDEHDLGRVIEIIECEEDCEDSA